VSARPEREGSRHQAGPGIGDALTFAFADPAVDVCGLVRLSVSDAGAASSQPLHAAALVLGAGGQAPVALHGQAPGAPPARWDELSTGELGVRARRSGEGWSLQASGPAARLELGFEPLAPAAVTGPPDALGGGLGPELEVQHGRVGGTLLVGGAEAKLDAVAQRTREWGAPDWKRLALVRSLGLWHDDGGGALVLAARPAGAGGHGEETTAGFVFAPEPPAAVPVADARLSATTDAEGTLVRAGLELWEGEDSEFPRRAGGQAVTGADLPTAGLSLTCSFLRGWMDGRAAVGVYRVLAPGGSARGRAGGL
jgi:hypothetical protein